MPNIQEFLGRFENIARANRFRVQGFGIGELEFFAKGATMPATTIGTLEVPYQGRIVKLDGDRVYEDFTMTIMDSDKFELRRQFEFWNLECNAAVENTGELTKRDGQLTLMDRKGNDVSSFKIYGALCISVGEAQMAWDTNDTILEYDVTIAYDYHEQL